MFIDYGRSLTLIAHRGRFRLQDRRRVDKWSELEEEVGKAGSKVPIRTGFLHFSVECTSGLKPVLLISSLARYRTSWRHDDLIFQRIRFLVLFVFFVPSGECNLGVGEFVIFKSNRTKPFLIAVAAGITVCLEPFFLFNLFHFQILVLQYFFNWYRNLKALLNFLSVNVVQTKINWPLQMKYSFNWSRYINLFFLLYRILHLIFAYYCLKSTEINEIVICTSNIFHLVIEYFVIKLLSLFQY